MYEGSKGEQRRIFEYLVVLRFVSLWLVLVLVLWFSDGFALSRDFGRLVNTFDGGTSAPCDMICVRASVALTLTLCVCVSVSFPLEEDNTVYSG